MNNSILQKRFCFFLNDQTCRIADKIAAALLAICPILQHYVGVVDNAATTLLVFLTPYFLMRLIPTLRNFKLSNLSFAGLLIIYFLYKLVNHGTYLNEIAQVGIMCFYLLCLCQNVIDTKTLKCTAVVIAALAGIGILIQYFTYYLINQYHLPMVPVSLLLPDSEQWIARAITGKVGVTGTISRFYRPSAFFLEPSHLFLYGFPGLFITLFDSKNRKNIIYAILISLGLALSTSGMGIAAVCGGWSLYFLLRDPKDNTFKLRNILRKQNLIFLGCFIGAAALAILTIPVIRESIIRIFFNAEGSTAIEGRVNKAFDLLKGLSLKKWIIGVSDYSGRLHFNKPGFVLTVYRYGIIGVILSYSVYIRGLFKQNFGYFWFSIVILITSFFSVHTHGIYFMLFYVALLKEGENVSQRPWIHEWLPSLCQLKKKIPLFNKDISQ